MEVEDRRSGKGLDAETGLDPWLTAALPSPTPFRGLNLFGIIGPGVIVLGVSIGSGEWLLGPATFVRYGVSLLWITTLGALFQTVFNTELIRYTMYAGEPAVVGFMRTRPKATFWAWVYSLFYFFQVGWPGWAGASAGAIFFLFFGRLPLDRDANTIFWIASLTFIACVLILLFGQRIERTLEILNWILLVFILGGLILLCIRYASTASWARVAVGYLGIDLDTGRFNLIPAGVDWFLVGAFAAYSGAGGVVNLMVSHWARDKGFGMGKITGFIPAVIGGKKVRLAHTGTIFKITPDSMEVWKSWWRVVTIDQWAIFFIGILLGMGLPAILYTSFIAPGTDIRGLAIAGELAEAMLKKGEGVIAYLVALMGAWVLFKTQLDIVEGMVRSVTDILWSGSTRIRRWRSGDVRVVYYGLLGLSVVWGLAALRLTQPIILLQLGANMAGIVFVVSSIHILYLNTHLLPAELRPPFWRRMLLVLMSIFYGFFVYLWLFGGFIPDPSKGFLFTILRSMLGG